MYFTTILRTMTTLEEQIEALNNERVRRLRDVDTEFDQKIYNVMENYSNHAWELHVPSIRDRDTFEITNGYVPLSKTPQLFNLCDVNVKMATKLLHDLESSGGYRDKCDIIPGKLEFDFTSPCNVQKCDVIPGQLEFVLTGPCNAHRTQCEMRYVNIKSRHTASYVRFDCLKIMMINLLDILKGT